MFSNTFEIGVQSTRKDSFVSISASFIKQAIVPLYGNKLPYCVPLKLTGKDGKCCYVGCLTSQDIPGKSNRISLSPTLASDLGLSSGEVVSCVPVSKAPRATRVLVDPFNVDESEVVEHNALRIEANLLRQIQVVYPGMTVTVNISAGLVAKVRVRLIECGEGNELKEGCAVMFDGTLFVVATRARDSDDAKGDTTPLSAIVRARPSSAATAVVGADVAARYRWTTGLEVGLLNLGHLALEKEPKMTPSFLRAHMVLAKLTVEEEEGGDGVALPGLDQPSNVLVIPNPGAVARVNEADASGEGEIEARLTLPAIQEVTAKVVIPSLEQLKTVHDKTLDELQSVLRYAFTSSDKGSVLLSGGKGFGKTVLSRCVCRWAEEEATVHTEYLDCVESKTFLDHLKSTLKRCVLCAPSMLVLDNLDRLAPSQEEGHVQSMSEVTRSVFDLVLSNTDRLSPVVEDHKITILATCASKDNLNERFRSPYCFQTNMALEPLRRPTRQSLLAQILPGVEEETLQKMVALMDNYTPFDVVHIAPRITKLYAERKQKGERNVTLQDCAEASVRDFTPLAHGGISFLKGEKRDWDLIGGLSEAKRHSTTP
ncbi:peroxisome biosynthesis protein-like protein [Angomonas deanei]|uniref:Peroxisome biogenesis factor 1, N-terminal/ATPase family associated with various cellular activities (AAA), putative n=1 Tax=Angomonas deanei TaxID=59799 RepID=A0A7G2CA12_9TRYP|nr:peroxisome biosynthesis protein-like protein [Angomonas deanei]CAD2214852.1 Peroxisome biogenesis factor 1, N-terminal/ATPase family associated with various cellular activities (AAA), putative [Angomonas deanei]|eukprot:EPY28706.1 peroxisome biosynthesis protein-like protein [Angomonas deanei]